jgi:hypothetical protein
MAFQAEEGAYHREAVVELLQEVGVTTKGVVELLQEADEITKKREKSLTYIHHHQPLVA